MSEPATVLSPEEALEHALAQPTLVHAFQATAAANADRPALRTLGSEDVLTFADYAARVRAVATGLAALGVRAGDAVGLMYTNRPDFFLADTAVQHLGATPFSIYHTNPAEQIVPLMRNAGARVVLAQPEYAETLAAVAEQIGTPERIVTDLTELEALPAPEGFDFDAAWRAVAPDDLALLIYTSGTTGEPKGVEWSHRALLANVVNVHRLLPASPHGRVLSYLPMAHLFERWFSHYGQIGLGYTVTCVPDAARLAEAIAAVHPTRFCAVPRIYEKLAAAIGARRDAGATTDEVRDALGFDAIEYLGSAAAPARPDTLEAFESLGLRIAEIWGMSETAMSLSNPVDRIKIGTVGRPMPGFEARLEPDGELCVRGPIFSGYRNEPQRTAEAVDADGWMHSGDIATVDEDGYYKIVDRKKEIIINSAGKNIPPAMVEARIKQHTPLVAHAVAIGDAKPYLTALLCLDEDALKAFAAEHGLDADATHARLTADPAVREAVAAGIDAANATLARIEQVKRFAILPDVWAPGGDEVTPSLKVKRRNVIARYADDVEALYAG
ncbi:MAG TPA: AMP-dependent synthetase/ligase [Baekduia sp.]|uniref:AMP-dependent synthetase/ligase n=1 Tax=Baekduia sp. TaxID=2600305 RepID=UPI002D79C2C1|nr:AMP-dependent synthetase/ligase [Baekduia sp.]HET6507928.1 AMP-dependent synthetase/ligase [Baekduia sp.]